MLEGLRGKAALGAFRGASARDVDALVTAIRGYAETLQPAPGDDSPTASALQAIVASQNSIGPEPCCSPLPVMCNAVSDRIASAPPTAST